jgi:hypothetical protein
MTMRDAWNSRVPVVSETPQEAFARGVDAGRIEARLDGHDQHFQSINGQLVKIFERLSSMDAGVQLLAQQAISRDATVITTAAALKDAEEARRQKTETRWTPLTRMVAVIGALAGVAAIVTLIVALAQQ